MLKFSSGFSISFFSIKKILFLLFSAIMFSVPGLSYADIGDNPLAQYQNMINNARSTPPKFAPSNNPAMSSGQAALTPAPNNQAAPVLNSAPAQFPNNYNSNVANTNTPNQPATQQAVPAGPPNIFVTPGGNTTNKQGGSVIHY